MSHAPKNKSLRESAILQSAVDFAIIATDQSGRVTDWNIGAEQILGWTAEEMLGQTVERFFTPEDRKAGIVEREMSEALAKGRASDDRWHLRQDGTRFFASGEMTPLRSAAGDHLGYLKILRDPTAAREAAAAMKSVQAQLAESESFLQRLLASSNDCIKVLDLDGRMTFMSEGGMRVMEVSDFNDIRGCPWPNFWEGEGNEHAKAALAAAREGRASSFVAPANTFLGTPRWWDVQVTSIPGPDGRPEKILSISRDITARYQAEDDLKQLNISLEQRVKEQTADRNALWRLSRDLMLRCSFEGVMTAVNPAWTDSLGWSKEELIGRSLFDFIHPDDLAHTIEGAQDLSEGRGHARFDNRYRCKDGSFRWISWTTQAGEGMINAIGRDITDDQQRQQALQEAEDALRQSQKMEAVGQLTGGIAHDFNNLLAVVTGSLELLDRRVTQGRLTEIDKFLSAAQTAAKRAAALTHRLLAFSRRQTLDPQATDVNRLVHGMDDMILRAIGPSIGLETVGTADLWNILVDPNQLENALLNLCINARDAMPDGGKLTIETANRWLDRRAAHERDMSPGQYVSLSVSDSGCGMPPEVIAKAFEPFFTTKPIGQGTGLGLSMIYGFARQSGGQVRIYSEAGEGTTVTLYLPRHLGEAVDIESGAPPVPSRAEQGDTVLVVDDEIGVRMLATEVLQELGYSSIEAADGPTALKIVQSGVRIDLLVTDVGLPGGMNGRQVADAARVVRPDLKVLFITGYAENAVVANGHLDQGMAVITKPFAVDAFANKVKELIDNTSGSLKPASQCPLP